MNNEDEVFDVIRTCAKRILKEIKEPNDLIEINRFLAELEPYPSYIIRIEEVK